MVGTFADVVIADAIVKSIPGFDTDLAVQALIKDSFSNPPPSAAGAVGKENLDAYDRLGYLPSEPSGHDYVSRTLDYAFSDWAVGQAFTSILKGDGLHKQSAVTSVTSNDLSSKKAKLISRAMKAHSSLFDSSRGLMVPKDGRGRMSTSGGGFDAVKWGFGYTEGNSWHHSFPAFAVNELAKLHGSKDKLAEKIKELIRIPSNFHAGSYGQEIHEMTEARAFSMGQYMHNNQPVHHILYILAAIGHAEEAQVYLRRVMDKAYGYDFYAGDEDNGEQGAWFVLSALGLFSLAPGSTDYVAGSPLFKHVVITRQSKDTISQGSYHAPLYTSDYSGIHTGLRPATDSDDGMVMKTPDSPVASGSTHIVSSGTGPDIVKVDGILVNDRLLDQWMVPHSDVVTDGGVVRFVMNGEGLGSGAEAHSNAHKFKLDSQMLLKSAIEKEKHDGILDVIGSSNIVTANDNSGGSSKQVEKLNAEMSSKIAEFKTKEEAWQETEAHFHSQQLASAGQIETLQHTVALLEQQIRSLPNHPTLPPNVPYIPLSSTETTFLFDTCIVLLMLFIVVGGWSLGAGYTVASMLRGALAILNRFIIKMTSFFCLSTSCCNHSKNIGRTV